MVVHIYAHNQYSEGAAELAGALGVRRIKHDNSRYVPSANKTIINWGSSQLPQGYERSRIINQPIRVGATSNKKRFFELLEDTDARVPDWTDERAEASRWLREGHKVIGRQTLTGHSGEGIVVFTPDNPENFLDYDRMPLYTMYVPKRMEYRVHFAFGALIDVQRKVRDPNREPTDWHVRSHDNGFIFVRNGVEDAMPQDVLQQAQIVAERCGLDFGAIDIIFNESRNMAYVLEVNSAPGLVGQTIESYADAFRHLL